MTRIAITKLAATALAVASLGIAGTAQAADPATGVDAVDSKVTQPAPAEQPGPATPAPAPAPVEEEKDIDYTSPEYFKSKEARDRFERYCNMKGAEPSHSDKKFCEDFRKHNPTGTTTSTGTGTRPIPEPCGIDNTRCPTKPGKPRPTTPTEVTEPSKGSLPFTGLEIWQLGLAGLVLGAGGFGVRRLLAS